MKYLCCAIVILALLAGKAYGQKSKKDTTTTHLKDDVKGGGINDIKDFYNKVGTANDKQNFANVLTAVAQFSGITTNGLTVKANIIQITSIAKQYQNSSDYYKTHGFARNFEIDLGGTPNNNNVIQYSKASAGFTYAILNNNYLREDDYNAFQNLADVKITTETMDALILIENDNPQYATQIQNFIRNDKRKNADLPKAVLDLLKQKKINDPATMLNAAQTDFKLYVVKAKARPLLTVSPNSDYDGTRGWFTDYGVKGNLTLYGFIWKMKMPWAFSLQPSYSIGKDTVKNTVYQNRKIYGASFSIDITPLYDKSAYTAILEVKPQVGYLRTNGELFLNEKRDQFSFMTTVTYTVSKNICYTHRYPGHAEKSDFIWFFINPIFAVG